MLNDHGPSESDVKGWHVIGQFSSVGSLGPDKDRWLCAEWLQSMSQCKGAGKRVQGESGSKTLKLVRRQSRVRSEVYLDNWLMGGWGRVYWEGVSSNV